MGREARRAVRSCHGRCVVRAFVIIFPPGERAPPPRVSRAHAAAAVREKGTRQGVSIAAALIREGSKEPAGAGA